MSIQVKKYTVKNHLWNDLTELISKGRELTYYNNVWAVNTKDNDYFLDYMNYINANNYIKPIDENTYYMNNKLMERMTKKEIATEIQKVKKIINKYETMTDWQRKIMASSERINHCNKLIKEYETKLLGIEETNIKYIYINAINNCKQTIKELENILVKESA